MAEHSKRFLSEQRVIFSQVSNVLISDLRVFPRVQTIKENGAGIKPIANEKGLEMYLNAKISGPVQATMEKLSLADKYENRSPYPQQEHLQRFQVPSLKFEKGVSSQKESVFVQNSAKD
ncbi:hypothetical protein E4U26_008106 [Claviceps purpurea]|nr:hypothetical protein E4U51_000346 [Claviceps purpurea]KAG6216601.1 hypothetical protein E4U26_008106 [Claviceps purpurea]